MVNINNYFKDIFRIKTKKNSRTRNMKSRTRNMKSRTRNMKSRTRNMKSRKTDKNKHIDMTIKKRYRLNKKVNMNKILLCDNKKHGCKLKAKPYICYNHVRTIKRKTKPDLIKFTSYKSKHSKKILPDILYLKSKKTSQQNEFGGYFGHEWYDCSHFKNKKFKIKT